MPIKKGQHTPEQLAVLREKLAAGRAVALANRAARGGALTEKQQAARSENIKKAQAASLEAHAAQQKVTKRNRRRAVKNVELEVSVRADVGRMGPAMLALPNDRMRKFVLALLSQGVRNAAAAYRAAGYKGTLGHNGTAKTQGGRLARDERVIAALHEEAKNHVRTGQLVDAIGAVDRILRNDRHRDQARVALGVYDRAGLHALSEQKVTVERLGGDPQRVDRIMLLLERLGMGVDDVKRLMGNRLAPQVEATDADYTEIEE